MPLFGFNPQIGDTLEEFLLEATPDPKLRQLMMSMSEAIRTIAYKVRTSQLCFTAREAHLRQLPER